MQLRTRSAAETETVAAAFAKTLRPGAVVAYRGDLGAGKTAFTRGLAVGLGVTGEVSSPTFALVHCYRAKFPICHFDMYRIHSFEELYSTGFFDYLDSGALLLIEWSENVAEFLPEGPIRVTLERLSDTGRKITIEGSELS